MRQVFAALLLALPALAQRPNLVLFVTDDQGAVAGCYGDPDAHTPHLDALAAEGVVFTRAFATTASCSASRSVILSGQHNHANGQYGHAHDFHHFQSFDAVRSLPAVLAESGYRTARVGKYHVAPASAYPFEVALDADSRHPVQMAESCREFLEDADDTPFFLYFCTSDPHRGGGVAADLPGTPDRFGNRGREGLERRVHDPEGVTVPAWLPRSREARAEWAQMLEAIARIDQGLGRLVEILEAAGEWEDTVLLFTSDHGPAFPGAKTTTYEPGLHVALVVRDPRRAGGGVREEALVSLLDLAPTLADLAGAPAAERWQGRSFRGFVAGAPPSEWRDAHFASHTFHEITMYYPMRVVRTDRYKLIWNLAHPLPYPFATDLWAASTWQAAWANGPDAPYGPRTVGEYVQRPRFELYDLRRDPLESTNLAGDPEHAAVLADLKARLRAFQESTGDPWILKWDYE